MLGIAARVAVAIDMAGSATGADAHDPRLLLHMPRRTLLQGNAGGSSGSGGNSFNVSHLLIFTGAASANPSDGTVHAALHAEQLASAQRLADVWMRMHACIKFFGLIRTWGALRSADGGPGVRDRRHRLPVRALPALDPQRRHQSQCALSIVFFCTETMPSWCCPAQRTHDAQLRRYCSIDKNLQDRAASGTG